ncbi:hypothetical protein HP15_1847 [Marinobacter adhaerens HP15]|uniref:Uncharacterized protein n=1 Tax=Marinobacter adhaerens (strain DSM 23420 / HP15) TaxID=225937 RepID=E4PPC4_MARAH|nr:hypothetical protein HP15_1847 [Marinobacter adhaerens HP15]
MIRIFDFSVLLLINAKSWSNTMNFLGIAGPQFYYDKSVQKTLSSLD